MWLDTYKDAVDESLRAYFLRAGSGSLEAAMAYSVNMGGKRVRPILVLLSSELFGGTRDDAMDMAMAIEMIHTYSLIHDDLPAMDNDDLRRGHPTNHRVFGEAMAILAGDALLNEAHSLLIRSYAMRSRKGAEASLVISEAAGRSGMVYGQVLDMENEKKEAPYSELLKCHRNKTGMLIAASLEAPAVFFGADRTEVEAMRDFGIKLGLAFQILDDILDHTSTKEVLGKTTGKDEKTKKTTFVSIFGLEKSREMAEVLTQECIGILDALPRDTERLKELAMKLLSRHY
jgi:geranylgeranyl diphosphate synthase type II